MSEVGQNASDSNSRLVELLDGDTTLALTTEDSAQLGAPSAPKRYALPTKWEQHKETIHRMYLAENQPLKKVMAVMAEDYGHFGSIKQYKNKLKKWKFDTKYKRHHGSKRRRDRRPKPRPDSTNCPTSAPLTEHLPNTDSLITDGNDLQVLDIEHAGNHQLRTASGLRADHYIPSTGSANALLFDIPGTVNAVDPFLQPTSLRYSGVGLSRAASTTHAASYPFHAADNELALDCVFGIDDVDKALETEGINTQHVKTPDVVGSSTLHIVHQAPTENEDDAQFSSPQRHCATSLAIGSRSGRSATPKISIAERIFSLAQQHVQTSFAYGIWNLDSKNNCKSLKCTDEDAELPEAYFDLIRSAVLLFDQGSVIEGRHMVSKAFALVNPILKSGNVRALNFFWTSLVFLVQFGHTVIVVSLIQYIYDVAKIVLHQGHPVVQMFKLLAHMDATELESLEDLVHNTWQITTDAFQDQLPRLHPEYVRHQCDLIFRIYGTKDATMAEQQLCNLLRDCEEAVHAPELSRMTILNALGYNFMNSKDWVQAANIGHKLEEQARLAQDIDLLVYQIGGMEIQARAFNELKLFRPAVACLERATPLIANQWGSDDPWRIELMVLQQNWLRENGEIKAADNLKADISSIAERIDSD